MLAAVHQPNYLPWPGFFHKWLLSDAIILLDTVQFEKNEWQNRNRIKTVSGAQWLTVPVHYRYPETIAEVTINSSPWVRKHITAIEQAYARAPHLDAYWQEILSILSQPWQRLRDVNVALIRALGGMLGCSAPLYLASQMHTHEADPSQRLISLCRELGADAYLSGQEGRNYLQADAFDRSGVSLCYQEVAAPVYSQLHGDFVSHLSVVDLLFNVGPEATDLICKMGGVNR